MRSNSTASTPSLLRVIDANLNRYREGIRVVEDIFRYLYNNKEISLSLKRLRHIKIDIKIEELLKERDIKEDVLKSSTKSEQQRDNIKDIVIANLKRAEESARVLEEVFKLYNVEISEKFKSSRYSLYNIEKVIFEFLV
jgi:thiamine-phosphate pyrophosphorylase